LYNKEPCEIVSQGFLPYYTSSFACEIISQAYILFLMAVITLFLKG
jgi:hypothetical protein